MASRKTFVLEIDVGFLPSMGAGHRIKGPLQSMLYHRYVGNAAKSFHEKAG
jgi:hypothetical protein